MAESEMTERMKNKKEKSEKAPFHGINRLRWLVFIVIGAISTILYVNNVLQINVLLKENQQLNKSLKNLKNNNELLRSELNRLESPERIISIAETKLGMIKSIRSPKILSIKKPD